MNLPRRLDKFVREAARTNLNEARKLIQAGTVSCTRFDSDVERLEEDTLVFDCDTILLSGRKLELPTEHHTYLLNKPPSVTTTTNDPRGKRDLKEWLVQMAPGTFPVGRLDRETTGALLCTTDGNLASAILRPDHQTTKTYWLWLNEALAPHDPRLQKWTEGLPMMGAVARAQSTEVLRATEDMTELLVTLSEGKNRQLRRMCYASDFRLLHLHRKSIGPLKVDNIALGTFRELLPADTEALWSAVGGRSRVLNRQRQALEKRARQLRQGGSPDARLEAWLLHYPDEPARHSDSD